MPCHREGHFINGRLAAQRAMNVRAMFCDLQKDEVRAACETDHKGARLGASCGGKYANLPILAGGRFGGCCPVNARSEPVVVLDSWWSGDEHGGPTMFARIGVMRALNRNVERVFDPSHKRKSFGTPKP